ncbi:MAG: tripartite tricarboxylate transporter substrate binding protein [Betaproteobacteria bacterium]|nr:MAG: tripartite tricarboxylate transporter substrate binding protein [Betaproteobacteria bacterium]
MTDQITRGILLGSALALTAASAVRADQDYPNRPIRWIVPYSPGGSTSWTARLVGEHLTSVWGQQVLVDNRPGANTVIGTDAGAKSKPDGYTVLYIGSALCSNVTLVKNLPYDTLKDIAPIATMWGYENVFVVHPSLPVKTVKEFVALAKKRPGELMFASSSHGGSTNLAPRLFNMVAKIETTQVPYKGAGNAMIDVIGGQVQYFMSVPVNIVPHVRSGKLRAIAVTGDKRISAFPDVPSMAELGYPEVSMNTWHGVGAPAGMPKSIIDKIATEIQKFVAMPETHKKLDAQGFVPYFNGPEETARMIKNDIDRFGKIIKAANIKY